MHFKKCSVILSIVAEKSKVHGQPVLNYETLYQKSERGQGM